MQQDIVFVPLYGRTLVERRAPWFLALALAISFFLVVLRPADWWLWPVFLVLATYGFLALRRPRRIRFGSWVVAERAPFPPWVFTRADADSVLSRLPPMRNEARLREILDQYRSGQVPTVRPEERDSADLDPRNELLRQIAFPWALIAGFAPLHALGESRVDARGGTKGYGSLVSGAVLATLYCALRLWDERYRDAVVVPPGASLARFARWNLGLALLTAVVLIVWCLRH